MGNGIELPINGQTPVIIENPELPTEQEIQLIEYLLQASGEENGAVYFNLDWQNRQAEYLRQALATIYGAPSTEQNQTENQTSSSWRDLINAAREHKDFKEFRRSPESFWQQVRQMSETRVGKDNAGRETRFASRFNELLTKMQEKNLSPREFAQTLPPNERAVFKAAYQLTQTFGANLFNGAAAADEVAQPRFGEVPADANRAAVSREGKFILSDAAPHGEMSFGAKSAALLNTNTVAAPQKSNVAASGNPILQNAAPPSAAGASSIMPENPAARGLNNSASANAANTGAAQTRDGGTAIGCALISGAFAAIENFQNSENIKIGGSRTRENNCGEGGGFAAGATGAMFGAAIGTIVPGAETVVSGVLGFVSGVVVGADADQGLRWLGAGAATFDATADGAANANNQKQLAPGNSLVSFSNPQPVLA